MATQQNQSGRRSSNVIPDNASEAQASQILGYGIGDIVILSDEVTSDKSSGGTSTGNTPNSTHSPGMAGTGSDMSKINIGYSSGNTASNPRDSHQASMSNAAPGQQFLVSRFDTSTRQFFAYKLNPDGTHDHTEVPLGADENYQRITDHPSS
jgi:hypothetical protein